MVAGGSEGIGLAFARRLAMAGHDLVLSAEKAQPLESVGREIAREFAVTVETVVGDLSDERSLEALCAIAHEREVGVLVCNAAVVPFGEFLKVGRDEKMRALAVNSSLSMPPSPFASEVLKRSSKRAPRSALGSAPGASSA